MDTGSGTREFRTFLQQELLRRCKSNPSYSLRAFAQALEIESSSLSKILHGRRRITPTMFDRFAKRLRLTPDQKQKFATSLTTSRRAQADYQQLGMDLFQVIAEWHHFAILELTQLEQFEADAGWIARALGLTNLEAQAAIDRLKRLELLKVKENGQWIDASGATTTIQDGVTSEMLRRFQRQILEKGIRALEEEPLDKRDHTSMTMAINSKMLPEAKKRIRKFRRELCAFLKSRRPYDEVYHLGVALYPVTRKGGKAE
jgi:uncharacterized protein (TIGR02147 family)